MSSIWGRGFYSHQVRPRAPTKTVFEASLEARRERYLSVTSEIFNYLFLPPSLAPGCFSLGLFHLCQTTTGTCGGRKAEWAVTAFVDNK